MPAKPRRDRTGQKRTAGIDLRRIRKVIAEARSLDAASDDAGPDRDVRGAARGKPDMSRAALMDFICGLDEETQIMLVALAWIGRGTYGAGEWEHALAEARNAHSSRTCEYLMSLPRLVHDLGEGLQAIES